MALDVGTLMAALVVVCAVVAWLLALTWSQNRGVLALGTWTTCFVLCGAAGALAAARGVLPEFNSIDTANALRLLAFGLAWQATRHFTGRSKNWGLVVAPVAVWLAAGLLIPFGEDYRLRVLVGSPLVAAYSFAMAGELVLARSRRPWVAGPAAVLLAFHGFFYVARFAAVLSPLPSAFEALFGNPLNSIAMFESLVIAIVLGFLLLSGAKEEVISHYRRAALLDPLTGVSNRRGFEAEAKRMLARAVRDGSSTALLLLDLDHFKSVNDKWGHLAGDAALREFTNAVAAELCDGDLLARLGGEEFAIALPDRRTDQAQQLAERIRRAVAALSVRVGPADIRLTVSVGVASLRNTDSLDALLKEADSALYRAKAGGRDRVESAFRGRVLAGVRWAQDGIEVRRVA